MTNYDVYEPETWQTAEQEDRKILQKYGSMDTYFNRIYDEQHEDNENIMKGDEIKIKAVIR